MTNRYNYLTVALEQNIRDDDAEQLVDAIMMLKGVLKVEGNVANGDAYTAEQRANDKWRSKLYSLILEDK